MLMFSTFTDWNASLGNYNIHFDIDILKFFMSLLVSKLIANWRVTIYVFINSKIFLY